MCHWGCARVYHSFEMMLDSMTIIYRYGEEEEEEENDLVDEDEVLRKR